MKHTEKSITDLLISKLDKKYVCVPQCKTGGSMYAGRGNMHKFDLWCMRRSWTHFHAVGYEIKVSRTDFLRDTKWPEYLPFCNEFYFVVPDKSVATPDEMPEGVGLKYVSKTGNMIYTKKRAVHRDVDIPQDIFAYILMWRADITRERIVDTTAFWQDWLKQKGDKYHLGYRVSRELRKFMSEERRDMRAEMNAIKHENERLGEIKEYLDSIGVDWRDQWGVKIKIVDKIAELKNGMTGQLIGHLHDARAAIDVLLKGDN